MTLKRSSGEMGSTPDCMQQAPDARIKRQHQQQAAACCNDAAAFVEWSAQQKQKQVEPGCLPNNEQGWQQQGHQVQQAQHSAPGCLANDVQGFLQRLTRGHCHVGAGFNDHVWQCFAEFNLTLEAHFPAVPASALRGYHAFTRMPKQHLAERYLAAQGLAGSSALPIQAQLALFVLDKVFASYHEAAIAKYTVEAPPWLLPWCQRWGLRPCPRGSVSVTALHAYAPASSLDAPTQPPIRVVYVPCFGQ